MSILLVFPKAFEPNETPPLGMSIIASCLRQQKYDVEMLDLTVTSLRKRDWSRYSVIGMTLLCANFDSGVDLAREIRQQNKNVFLVAGGPFPDINPRDVLDTGLFNVVMHGEGEEVFVHLADALKKDGNFSGVNGLSFYRDGKIVRTPDQPLIKDLDAIPFPAYDLLPLKRYYEVSIMASRGCAHQCIFCTRGPTESKEVRRLSPRRVLEWIGFIKDEIGFNTIRFVDSTFTANQKWAEEICDLIIEKKIKFRWSCQTRVDCVNARLLAKMRFAGCDLVVLGAESGNDDILKKLKKDFLRADIINTARIFKETRAPKLLLNFIVGHPWDTDETICETVEFAKELHKRFGTEYKFFLLTPFPGTELWENAQCYGLTIERNWKNFCKYSFMGDASRIQANFGTKNFSREELTRIYHRLAKPVFPFSIKYAKKLIRILRWALRPRK